MAREDEREFLAFRLGPEEYVIEILSVQEIRSYEDPMRMVGAPSYVNGVINLRGLIVPIIDLRKRLEMESAPYDGFTAVIVLNVARGVVGAVVDSVADVVKISERDVHPLPDVTQNGKGFSGVASVNERSLIVVDAEALVGSTGAKGSSV